MIFAKIKSKEKKKSHTFKMTISKKDVNGVVVSVEQLKELISLQHVNLSNCYKITDNGIKHLKNLLFKTENFVKQRYFLILSRPIMRILL